MKNADLKNRMCGVGNVAMKSTATAGACGIAPVASGRAKTAGTGFAIRPMRPGHRRSLDAALKMGHCAPAVMAALIDDNDPGWEGAVLLSSAMAGGIGNSGRECGALTSAVLYLGQRYGSAPTVAGIPLSITLAGRLIERFGHIHGGIHCDDIRKGGKNPLPCMKAMVSAPQLVEEVISEGVPRADGADPGCHTTGLFSACEARRFHCAHGVFAGLSGIVPPCERLLDMTYPLVGGIALSGGTCSAAAAGVLAIGLATGKIEKSYVRVMAMMARMFIGGDALMMPDHVNNFNPAINRGQLLMEWFAEIYGSVRCRDLTGIDIRESETTGRYFVGGGIDRCKEIAGAVACKVREIVGGADNSLR